MTEEYKNEDKDNETVDSAEDTELEPVQVDNLSDYEIKQAEKAIDVAQDEYGASDANPDVVSVRDRIEDTKTAQKTAEDGLAVEDDDTKTDRQSEKEDR